MMIERPTDQITQKNFLEPLERDPDVRQQIAGFLVEGKHTSEICDLIEEQHGRGYRTAIWKAIDSSPKAIEFVRANRPESTREEIKKISFNRNNSGHYTRHFDNL